MSKRPNIPFDVLRELETFGVEPMKITLMNQAGDNRDDLVKFGKVVAKRGDIHDWLKWKANKEAWWIRFNTVVALFAMVAAIAAA